MGRVATTPQAFGPTSAAPRSAFVILRVEAYARAEFFYLAAYFRCFCSAANCEETGELVAVSASAGALKKIAAIKMAKNFIIGSPAS
jgi:hypothetical protein